MPNYKLSETAEADLVRIYRFGFQLKLILFEYIVLDFSDTDKHKLISISLRFSITLNNSQSSRFHIQ